MSLFMGSLMSGVFNWVMDRFMGVTECYLVTPLSRWEIAGGILASGVTITSIAAIIVLFVGLLVTGATIEGGLPALLTIIGIIISRGDRPARDDVFGARPRDASAAGGNLRGLPECDPVFSRAARFIRSRVFRDGSAPSRASTPRCMRSVR